MEIKTKRIFYLNHDAQKGNEAYRDHLVTNIRAWASERTEVTMEWLKEEYAYTDPVYTYQESYQAVVSAQAIYHAEKRGFDAAITACMLDMGLRESRAIVSIPVVGVLESAIALAISLGDKFSIITLHKPIEAMFRNLIRLYGVGDRVAGVLNLGLNVPECLTLHKEPQRLISVFKECAMKAINQDGAEVIIPGCTGIGSVLTLEKIFDIDGVPIVDGVWAAIKMAELWVDVRRQCGIQICRNTIYASQSDWEKEIAPKEVSSPQVPIHTVTGSR